MKKFLVALLFFGLVFQGVDLNVSDCYAKGGRSSFGGSRSSSFGGSRSSSRPSTRPSSRPSTPSARPSTRPSTPSTRPSTRPTAPSSTKPSAKPSSSYDSRAAAASKKQSSASTYKKATQPKTSYTTPSGKSVKVDPKSTSTQRVRSMSSQDYANRSTRVEHHYHNHYGSRYDYYRSQPYIYVGGGYSPLFWYCMMDWELDRRARWMYNNQHTIDTALYQQELAKNAQLQAEIAKLEAANTPVDPNYVDPEFKDNPDLMYSDEYVNAAYNPEVVAPPPSEGSLLWLWILLGVIIVGVGIYFVFFHNFQRRSL